VQLTQKSCDFSIQTAGCCCCIAHVAIQSLQNKSAILSKILISDGQ